MSASKKGKVNKNIIEIKGKTIHLEYPERKEERQDNPDEISRKITLKNNNYIFKEFSPLISLI